MHTRFIDGTVIVYSVPRWADPAVYAAESPPLGISLLLDTLADATHDIVAMGIFVNLHLICNMSRFIDTVMTLI